MTEHKTFPGKTYCVTSAEGCTVTDSTGALSMECEAGKQLHLTAPSDKLFTSASAIVREVFKLAPAKLRALGLLGGGVSSLPAGYLAAEFLEATGSQRLKLGITQPGTAEYDLQFTAVDSDNSCMGYDFSYSKWGVLANKQYRLGAKANTLPEYAAGRQKVTFAIIPNETKATLQINNGAVYSYLDARIDASGEWCLWQATDDSTTNCKARIWRFSLKSLNEDLLLSLLPAINAKGQACFYDTVQKKELVNTALYVGLTLAQARKLGKLPAGGGTLTVSLPSNWQEDDGVLNARAEAEAKGWQITVRTYEAEAGAAATFALRRIWVRKQQDEGGSYVAADGSRWRVDWCVDIWGASPQEHGYEPFRSVDAAVAYWELQPYVYTEEELLNVQ